MVLFQERLTINTIEQPAAERRCQEIASVLDEKIVRGSLGNFSLFIQIDHIGIAVVLGQTTGPIIACTICPFMLVHPIVCISSFCPTHATELCCSITLVVLECY